MTILNLKFRLQIDQNNCAGLDVIIYKRACSIITVVDLKECIEKDSFEDIIIYSMKGSDEAEFSDLMLKTHNCVYNYGHFVAIATKVYARYNWPGDIISLYERDNIYPPLNCVIPIEMQLITTNEEMIEYDKKVQTITKHLEAYDMEEL